MRIYKRLRTSSFYVCQIAQWYTKIPERTTDSRQSQRQTSNEQVSRRYQQYELAHRRSNMTWCLFDNLVHCLHPGTENDSSHYSKGALATNKAHHDTGLICSILRVVTMASYVVLICGSSAVLPSPARRTRISGASSLRPFMIRSLDFPVEMDIWSRWWQKIGRQDGIARTQSL